MSGTPSQSRNQRQNSGVYLGPTRGSRRCCGGALIQQGIGQIEFPSATMGGFSNGFSSGFDIT
jgi:hypothetical protein